MNDLMQQVLERQQRARTFRKKGDALRKAAREEPAVEAYQAGVAELVQAHDLLQSHRQQLSPLSAPSEEASLALRELVEVCGALGGLYQRLDMLDKALSSYSEGADLEEHLNLRSTYNRVNEVKYMLLAGRVSSEVIPKVQQLAALINANLRADMSMGDSGWALADLADCLALLGQVEEARQTYARFIAKAELKSPERALEVLKKIASRMQVAQDPDARRVQVAVEMLESNLAVS